VAGCRQARQDLGRNERQNCRLLRADAPPPPPESAGPGDGSDGSDADPAEDGAAPDDPAGGASHRAKALAPPAPAPARARAEVSAAGPATHRPGSGKLPCGLGTVEGLCGSGRRAPDALGAGGGSGGGGGGGAQRAPEERQRGWDDGSSAAGGPGGTGLEAPDRQREAARRRAEAEARRRAEVEARQQARGGPRSPEGDACGGGAGGPEAELRAVEAQLAGEGLSAAKVFALKKQVVPAASRARDFAVARAASAGGAAAGAVGGTGAFVGDLWRRAPVHIHSGGRLFTSAGYNAVGRSHRRQTANPLP
jgi:hypothetical protein